jgi:hypothetical protein
MGLRHFVDNINKAPDFALRNGIYQALDKETPYSRMIDGFIYEYQLKDLGNKMLRTIRIICKEARFKDIPEKEADLYVTAALVAMLDKGQEPPTIEPIRPDCIQITQKFTPHILTRVNN